MIATALYLAMGLKYDDWIVSTHREMVIGVSPILAITTIGMFALLRIYRRSWSNATVDDMAKLATAVIAGSAATYLISRLTMPAPPSATFSITYTLVMVVIATGCRASYRLLMHWNRESNRGGDPVIIYGAGIGGTLALREILANQDVPMKPIGFLDDDPAMHGRFINGYPVLGGLDDLANVVMVGKARGVVIASDKIPIAKVRSAQQTCESLGAWMRIFSVNFRHVDVDHEVA
jgi:FlaA1/EpsC-like NDP-sugar epimerase